MKKFGLFLLLSAFCIALSGADVFVFKPVKFQYQGVVEVLKKVLAEGEAALPDNFEKIEVIAGTVADKNLSAVFKKFFSGKTLKDDGFAVVIEANKVYLIGNVERAAIYAACDFLEKRAGFYRRVRPLDNGTPGKKVDLTPGAWMSNPAYSLRGVAGFAYKGLQADFLDWEMMNCYNFRPFHMKENGQRSELIRRGYDIKHTGHAFYYWINNKDFDQHPEYFPLINGKRQKFEKWNYSTKRMINVGNKKLQDLVVKRMFDYMDKYPETTMIAMGMNDGMGWGDSPEERAMDDPDEYKRGVYSTRYFRFCNIIAEKFCKRYPDVQIFVYAYLTAVEPPKLKKLHPNLFISLCTYRRDYKHRINDPASSVNARWNKLILEWKKFGNPLYIRDYVKFGGSPAFDVPLLKILQQDLQYYLSIGVNGYHTEGIVDGARPGTAPELLKKYKQKNGSEMCRTYWHGMKKVFHILGRLLWDPYADMETLEADYYNFYYGPAAEFMRNINRRIAQRWESDPSPYIWNKYDTNFPAMLFQQGDMEYIKKQLALAGAAVRKSGNKLFIERIAREAELINGEYSRRYNVPKREMTATLFKGKISFEEVKKHALANKGFFNNMNVRLRKENKVIPSAYPASVYCAVQGDKLIIAAESDQKNVKVSGIKWGRDNRNWRGNSSFELFISAGPQKSNDGYYQLVITPEGELWDGRLSDVKWNCNAAVSAQKSGNRWQMVIAIPLAELGYSDSVKDFKVRMNVGRTVFDAVSNEKEVSSWSDGSFANESAFGTVYVKR